MAVTAFADTDPDILACFATMAELRPHLRRDDFVAQVRRQMAHGFALIAHRDDTGRVVAVAGIRIAEWLATGLHLEIEDLVTAATARSAGHGQTLFDWIVAYARSRGCREIKLVSAVHRDGAHRFYFARGMRIAAHHFTLALDTPA